MKNKKFHFTIRKMVTAEGERLTVGRIAEAIFVNRAHLTDVLNNTPGHGGNTRWKVVEYLKKNHPEKVNDLLAALGWDENGTLLEVQQSVPRGTVPSGTATGGKENGGAHGG